MRTCFWRMFSLQVGQGCALAKCSACRAAKCASILRATMRPAWCPNCSIWAKVVSCGGPYSPKPCCASKVTNSSNRFFMSGDRSKSSFRASLLMVDSFLKEPLCLGALPIYSSKHQYPPRRIPRRIRNNQTKSQVRSCTPWAFEAKKPTSLTSQTLLD